jgi:cyclopropane-fatty-acyl-phospholipid synthase
MTIAVPNLQSAPRRFRAVAKLLSNNWAAGRLTLTLPDRKQLNLAGQQPGPTASMTVRDYHFVDRVFSRGLLGFGEGFMAGEWDTPDLSALLLTFSRNLDRFSGMIGGNAFSRWVLNFWHALHANTKAGSRRNIEAHYDLGNDFYALWLDETMSYSSARFDTGANDMVAAQHAKYAALARLMDLRPEHHVLEIGCGWGGFAEYAAKQIGCRVTGITISPSQLAFAEARMERAGVADRVDLQLIDYRDVKGQFDRIASIEMFEAVGEAYWPTYFAQVHDLLKPGGKAGLQIISIREDLFAGYKHQADFIQRYIFPGGMLPSPSRLEKETAKARLSLLGVEYFSEDYGRTLREWRDRFEAVTPQVLALGFDQTFLRMWRYYLAYCEAGFRTRRTEVGQWTLQKG